MPAAPVVLPDWLNEPPVEYVPTTRDSELLVELDEDVIVYIDS